MNIDIVQVATLGGAAGVAIYILKLVIDGKLHTDGEIKVRDDQIGDLKKQVESLTNALEAANKQSETYLALIQQRAIIQHGR